MAQWELVSDRLISGRASFVLPDAVRNKSKSVRILSRLIRVPTSPYFSAKSNPFESFYGRISFLRKGFVINTADIKYDNQVFTFDYGNLSQVLERYICGEQQIVLRILQLAQALGFSLSPAPPDPNSYQLANSLFDEFRIVCYGSSALQISLYSLEIEKCRNKAPLEDDFPVLPPKPPVEQGNPLLPPSAYDPPDNGESASNNIPFAGDVTTPPSPLLFRVRTKGLSPFPGCEPTGNFVSDTFLATTVSWDARPAVSGNNFDGCSFDHLVVDGVSRYPSLSGGSAVGTGIVELLDNQGNLLQSFPPGSPYPPS
jgi:hypothetical protein